MRPDDPDDKRILTALKDLNRLIIERIQREQRRDQLTGLPNGLALDELLKHQIERSSDIWAAFIEIDKFKSINDQFGQKNADELLKDLGRLLKDLSKSFPEAPDAVHVFRAHGDEFFIVGTHDRPNPSRPTMLSGLLELTRKKVRELSITVERPPDRKAFGCSVSIGWLVLDDVPPPRTAPKILHCLERAVDEAKRTRNRVIRYSSELRDRQSVSLRADCSFCRSKFTVDIPIDVNRADTSLHCPNCHESVERPPVQIETPLAPPAEV